jgi:hypothetical protein
LKNCEEENHNLEKTIDNFKKQLDKKTEYYEKIKSKIGSHKKRTDVDNRKVELLQEI